MWKKIDTDLMVSQIKVGNIITNNPENSKDLYEIKSIRNGYITASHESDILRVKYFPAKELLANNWWIKNKLD